MMSTGLLETCREVK